jgi:hypothetical protein
MDDEKKVIEKRSSFRGWKERNKGKSQQKTYIIAAVTLAVIFSSLIIFQYLNQNDNISIPVISANSSNGSKNSSLIGAKPEIITPEITPVVTPKTTPVVTPEITKNIIGKMGIPLVLNGFEINVTRADSSVMYTRVWIIAKNIEDVEKPFKIGPSTVVIDNIGLQYERVQVTRSAEIVQTNLAARAMREGSIFFEPLKEGRSPKKLILEINGKKAEIMLENNE